MSSNTVKQNEARPSATNASVSNPLYVPAGVPIQHPLVLLDVGLEDVLA